MTYYLYKITNLVNNKIYFGKAKNIKIRWNAHKTSAIRKEPDDYFYIHRAMNCYGFDNFIIEKVAEFPTETEAFAAEVEHIKIYNTKNRSIGYNLTDGGEGTSGFKFSNEQKQRLSAAKKGKCLGEENPFYGKKHTDEFKSNLSDIKKIIYQENKEKYDALNIAQCALNTEQCILIQKEWLTANISFEELAAKYLVKLTAIYKIIHGTYAAIKNYSIITEEFFQQTKKLRQIKQGLIYHKFSENEELLIANDYYSGKLINELIVKWNCSSPTISKILKKYNVPVKKGTAAKAAKHKSNLTDQNIRDIKEKYKTNNFSYVELGNSYSVSEQVIARIIQGKTFKNVI